MIGHRINGEQAEHLARFMAADRARCAFEDDGHKADVRVGVVMLLVLAAYLLVDIFEVIV